MEARVGESFKKEDMSQSITTAKESANKGILK